MPWDFIKDCLKIKARLRSDFTLPVVFLACSLLLFWGIVADLLARGRLFQLDAQVLRWAAGVSSHSATRIMTALSFLGSRPGIELTAVPIALYLYAKKRWGDLLSLALAYGGGEIISAGLKPIYQRPRPAMPLVEATGYSFPSGHALFIMLIYGFLAYLIWHAALGKKLKLSLVALLILLGLGVGASRLYLQAHWLTDVLAGYLAGLAWLTISLVAGRALSPPKGDGT